MTKMEKVFSCLAIIGIFFLAYSKLTDQFDEKYQEGFYDGQQATFKALNFDTFRSSVSTITTDYKNKFVEIKYMEARP